MKHRLQQSTIRRYNSGQAMLTAVIFFVIIASTIVIGIATPIIKHIKISNDLAHSRESYVLAQSAGEDIVYRLERGKSVSSTETLSLNGGTATSSVADTATGKQITVTASALNDIRKIQINLLLGTGISFHYGIQAGNGGFVLQNSSNVIGNVFSSGSVTGSGNYIYGDVVSAGSSGLVDGIHATGTVFAHNIRKTTSNPTIIDKDAYYVNKDAAVVVSGASYPNSPDQASAPLPISDAQIDEWESDAAAGGSVTCSSGSYTINSDVTIGPKKIPCDLNIVGSGGGISITVAGPLWVTGNITVTNKATIKMASSLGNQNVAIIAHNPSNEAGSGIISIGQNTIFQGSGSAGSFVFMISQNKSAEQGGSTNALSMNNGASALVAYASHGQITLSQSVGIKEVTAYKIILQNTASVTYDTGLPSVLFSSGPAGGYDITSWKEVE